MNIELQVLGSALRAVAEEMGAVLVRSAFSANIKERRDCSTALFAEDGRMIAQAEHIPVHLGAMPEAVAAVRGHEPGVGETFVVNDPFTGGTHLPDITLVSRTEVGFAVSRAHYADVGGAEPASLPADSTDLFQEGLVLPPVRLTDEVVTIVLANMRNPDERRGDLGPSSPRTDSPSAGSPSSASAAAGTRSRLRWTSSTPTPSAGSAPRWPRFRTAATKRPTCSRRSRRSSSSVRP